MTADDERALLAAGHALGNLTPEEEAAYQAWLAEDPDHRAEARQLAQASAAVRAEAPEQQPDPALKARILDRLATTPQQTPAARHPLERDALAPAPPAARETVGPAPHRPPRQKGRRRLLASVAAVLAAAVLFVGGLALGTATHPVTAPSTSPAEAQAQELARIASAPDAQRTTTEIAGGGQVTLVWSDSVAASAIIANGMAPAPAGKTYQLWYMRGGHATPAGFMPSTASVRPWAVLTGQLQPGDAVGITVEPSGGSAQPTSKPIVTFAVES